MKPVALLDSNVLSAKLAEGHERDGPSFAPLANDDRAYFAVSVHSYAEA